MTTIPISDGNPKDSYTATAGQTIFPYTFFVREAAHIAVFINGTLKTLTTDYTVSAVQSATGANVVLTTGAAEDDLVVLVYDPEYERLTEFTGTIRLEALNLELTYLLTLIKNNKRIGDASIKISDSETVSFNSELPALTGNGGKVIALDAPGTGLQYVTISDSSTITSNYEEGSFSGDNAETQFTLSFTPASQNAILIWVDDVRQRPVTDYAISGAVITFVTAPATGTDNITFLNTNAATAVNTPADGSVTTVKIVDLNVTSAKLSLNSVTTTKIVDDAVTLDKLAHGTQGDILYYGASGEPFRLGAGTAGQVLQSGGAGANPSWIAAPTSGSLVKLGTFTASSSSSVDIGSGLDINAVIDNTYERYVIEIINLVPASAGKLFLRTSSDTGSSFDNGSSDYNWNLYSFSSNGSDASQTADTADTEIELTQANISTTSGRSLSGFIILYNPAATAVETLVKIDMSYNSGGTIENTIGNAARSENTAVNAVRILSSAGNITSGQFKLYGVVK